MNNNILCVQKSIVADPLSTDEVMRIFSETNDMSVIRQAVEQAEERLYVTWASVEMVDNAGELIPINDIIDKQEILLKRNGSVTDNHSNKVVGQTLAYKILEHPETKTMGVMHLDKIFDDYALDDVVWQEIVSGERQGSSVGGTKKEMELGFDENGKMVKILKGFEHFETASVHRGCNPLALNEAFSLVAKSDIRKESSDSRINQAMQHENTLGAGARQRKHLNPDEKFKAVMREFERGTLHSGDGKIVHNRDQAIAIAYSESGKDKSVGKADKIPGGKSEGKTWNDIFGDMSEEEAKRKLDAGIKVEMEHTDDPKIAEEIALDHLMEDINYYKKLKTIEKTNVQGSVNTETDINKKNTETKGDSMSEENFDVKKSIEDLTSVVKTLVEDVKSLKNVQKEDVPDEKEEKEEKMEDEKKSVSKEDAASDIDGVNDGGSTDSPDEDDSNEKDVFKSQMESMKKELADVNKKLVEVQKLNTPRPSSVSKKDSENSKLALSIANGDVKKSFNEIHPLFRNGLSN